MPRVGLISGWNQLYLPLATIAAPIMQQYCERHGYTFLGSDCYHDRAETQEDRMTRGDLFKAGQFRRYYSQFDILMVLDIDSVIMNHAIRIEDVLGDRDWLWTYNGDSPLSGFWIARCTPLMLRWVERFSFACAYEYGGGDQYAMREIMHWPPWNKVIVENCISAKSAGHCFPTELVPHDLPEFGRYEEGDFIITFPSLDLARRIDLMAQYAAQAKL